MCDEVCKFREGRTQEELDAICERCKVERWAQGRAPELPKVKGPSDRQTTPSGCTTHSELVEAMEAHLRAQKQVGREMGTILDHPPAPPFRGQ